MEEAKGRIGYLDGWRGCAILFVLLGHFVRGRAFWAGPFGVELFFALSGALMADILLVRQVPLKPFFARRATRVYPALIVFVACMAAISRPLGMAGTPDDLHVTPGAIVAALTFTSNYYMLATQTHSIIGHTWSLCVEEASYLLIAAIAGSTGRNAKAAGTICLVIALAGMANGLVRFLFTNYAEWSDIYWRTDVRLSSVLLPVALSALCGDRLASPLVTPLCLAIGIVTFAFAPVPLHYIVGTTALGIAVTALPGSSAWLKDILSTNALRSVGLISFSLYLWQQPFWFWASRLGPGWRVPCLLACLAVAVASYRLVEAPVRRRLNRLLDLRRRTMDRTLPAAPAGTICR